ncbi:MAG: bifunctional 4-hydroxy-3-methylbut-2-enyl diphosphate reductase/30S ribosomal protein S1 [Clostridia bacterium]|nr:bifunctional 4-hydroxy-3-methylbut-2-enyl diphosphate reductase/30S ribosomal protein S1 [Clostridia bacterium]
MDIKVSKYAGFCFGVKRAVDMVNELLDDPSNGRIFSLGDIIHNSHAMNALKSKGLTVISQDDIANISAEAVEGSPCTVVIRAHGIDLSVENKLTAYENANPYFRVCDLTCPFVKKIHNIVIDNTSRDSLLIVYGDKDHPEVRGIVGRASGEVSVVSSAEELDLCNFNNKTTIMVAQTTKKLYEWEKCKKNLKNFCTNPIFFDTICGVTEKRQNDILCLAESSDLVLVIGDKNSSNSMSLLALAKTVCENSYLIESASDIGNISLLGINKVAITAGASTPGFIIEEVIKTMSEVVNTNEQANESFASMLESSLKTLNTGDIVTGVITSISNTEIHVDLSCKGTGILSVDEIRTDPNTDVRSLYKVGDEIEAFVVRVSDVEGVVGLSRRRIDRIADWKKIKAASEEGAVLEGKITEVTKGGVIATLGTSKVFIPASQSGVPASGDLNTLVGTTQKFIIIEVNDQKNRAVGSIRAILRRERKALLEKFWAEMEEGKKFTGTVKSMTSYGVFVDLGGVDGMVHVSELSWSRVKDPSEVVKVGDSIDVFVKSFDAEKKRISLGCKTEETNPWNLFNAQYAVGDVATVTVVGITPFGAFAEIIPEVDGLIHISQIADKRIGNPGEVLTVGQSVEAKIIAIDDEKQKVSLSIRALLETATETAEEAAVEEEDDGADSLVYSSDNPTALPEDAE